MQARELFDPWIIYGGTAPVGRKYSDPNLASIITWQ